MANTIADFTAPSDMVRGFVFREFGTQLTDDEALSIIGIIGHASVREAAVVVPYPLVAIAAERVRKALFPVTVRVTLPACSCPDEGFDRTWLDEVWWRLCELQPGRVDVSGNFTDAEYGRLRQMEPGTSAHDAAEKLAGAE